MNWQSTIVIHRPVERVSAFVTDPDRGTRGHRSNRITPESRGPIRPGSTYRGTGRFLFWKFDSVSQVTAYEENRLVEYSSDTGMYACTLRYLLERAPAARALPRRAMRTLRVCSNSPSACLPEGPGRTSNAV